MYIRKSGKGGGGRIRTDVPYSMVYRKAANQPATEEESRKIILALSSASCNLGPIPTPLLKICVEELLPIITKIVNASLSSCTLPDYERRSTCYTTTEKKHHLTLKP